jgi:hypothetical protein
LEFGAGADRDNHVPFHNYHSFAKDGSRSIHGYDGSAADDHINSVSGPLRRKRHGKKKWKGKNQTHKPAKGHLLPRRLTPQPLSKCLLQRLQASP